MSKVSTLSMIALFLFFVLTCAARPDPALVESQSWDDGAKKNGVGSEESCKGVDKEECLMRRTLEAHVDYIYTQHNK